MIRAFLVIAFLSVLFCAAPTRASSGQGSVEEAQALALKAAAFLKEVGEEKAIAAFNAGGEWKDRDLYVTVTRDDGTTTANSNVLAMVGKNLIDLKDVDGVYLVREVLKIQTTGWVAYKWPNPVTKRISIKKSFVVRVGPNVIFVGAYE